MFEEKEGLGIEDHVEEKLDDLKVVNMHDQVDERGKERVLKPTVVERRIRGQRRRPECCFVAAGVVGCQGST